MQAACASCLGFLSRWSRGHGYSRSRSGSPRTRQWLRCLRGRRRPGRAAAGGGHNDFLWAKILLLHAENLFIDFGAES
jgi:hypothetical protein